MFSVQETLDTKRQTLAAVVVCGTPYIPSNVKKTKKSNLVDLCCTPVQLSRTEGQIAYIFIVAKAWLSPSKGIELGNLFV